MKNKIFSFIICSLITTNLFVAGCAFNEYDRNQILQKEGERSKSLLKIAKDVVNEQEIIISNYKEQISYYEDQMLILNEYTKKEELNKARVIENREPVTFDATDIRIPSGATVEELTLALKNTALEHLAPAYIDLEHEYGWNAIAAASITAHETYWGTDYKTTEYNNLGGVRERNGNYWMFTSQEECIDYIGSLISRKYLDTNGEYFNGYGLKDINIMYCPVGGDTWSEDITQIAEGLIERISNVK